MSGRWPWLGHPLFLVSVAVLALNDHVLKLQFPSWWTGKLSDVAGVAVVGTLLSVLVGTISGLTMTGVGFFLLKTVPGVAELATPILGGVTARDTTDLVALLVLAPLYVALQRGGSHGASPLIRRSAGARRLSWQRPDRQPSAGKRASLLPCPPSARSPRS